jgi:DNA helicase-2/ATP-dependent DNA helicase PcrA
MTVSNEHWSGEGHLTAVELALALRQDPPTSEQVAVIESGPSPALVVAGAGSGKTATMAARVVWLVANGHLRREEVLGLTFTRKAAGELGERISSRLDRIDEYTRRGLLPLLPELVASGRLGEQLPKSDRERREFLDKLAEEFGVSAPSADQDDASALLLRPKVATYNSFADALVREHGAQIGRDSDAVLLSESAAWLLARRVVIESKDPGLAELDIAPNTLAGLVVDLAGTALDHRADLEEVATWGRDWVKQLLPHVERDRGPGHPENAADALTRLDMLAKLAIAYGEAKVQRGVFDFADQVSGALDVIEQSPAVAEQLRDQYRVVLLDEYQDTSALQASLLASIFADTPVMAVGDPNQAIYGWRGASANNLFAFGSVFSADGRAERFNLSISFRNDRNILKAANALLADRKDASVLEVPSLRASEHASSGRVAVAYKETIEDEAAAVADWFVSVRQQHVAGGNELSSHSGAILFRAKKHMQLFAEALGERGIPYRVLGLGGLLATPEVTDVVSVLQVIDDTTAGSALIRILAGPRFAIGLSDLSALHSLAKTLARRDVKFAPLDEDLVERLRSSAGPDESASIIDTLDFVRTAKPGSGLLSGFSELGVARLREAGEMFARLRMASRMPLPELLRQIETELRLDIELPANEARGPASRAMSMLRAFNDEVRTFLSASERESISALLAWIEHAAEKDELRPRPEPAEPGVVQLLTIHGAKGLEWDAVATVRWVAGEMPGVPKNMMGWLRNGQLPYVFRKDRDALPQLQWDDTEPFDRKNIDRSISAFREQERGYLEAEQRRLAYVALTRARTDLLISGSWWATQQKPRPQSEYLAPIIDSLGLDEIKATEYIENPRGKEGRTLSWPLDPLGSRRKVVESAAALVRGVTDAEASAELALLLAEREERRRTQVFAQPRRVSASMYKDLLADYGGVLHAIARPMPERPFPQTALGTLFHNWVEQRYQTAGVASLDDSLWESDQETEFAGAASKDELVAFEKLKANFERSAWGRLAPRHVELEIQFPFGDAAEDSEHIVICKLDAVFETIAGRIEIVDWKTGKPPANKREKDGRMIQLALYRLAYHYRFGVPLDQIDVALYYVADDLVIREDEPYSEESLRQRWSAARAARSASDSGSSPEIDSGD